MFTTTETASAAAGAEGENATEIGPRLRDAALDVRAAQIAAAMRTPGEAGRAALRELTGARVLVCPPRTFALDPVTGQIKAEYAEMLVGERRAPPAPRRARKKAADLRVVLRVAPNPKKPGSSSRERYECWRVGETVEAAVARGLTRADVRWDVRAGYVDLGPAR